MDDVKSKIDSPRSLKRNRGFTLVELIIAITVMAILTGAVTVGVSDINSNTRLSNAASRALADVRFAQELAMANRREVDVIVNVASNRYEIRWHDTGAYVESPYDGGDMYVQFGTGDYFDISIISTQFSSRLSFTSTGQPLNNGSSFSSERSVMFLNSEYHVVVYSSGYSALEEVVGGGGCGC